MIQNGVNRAGRPRAFDEEAVLGRALELFWSHGVRGTSTRLLERELGLRASSIYNAFGSKEALLDRAVTHYEHRITDHLVAPLEAGDEGLAAIERFFVDLVDWVGADEHRGCLIVNLMAEIGTDDPDIAARTSAYRGRVRDALSAALDRAVAIGEVSDVDVAARSTLLYGAVLGLSVAARGGAGRDELEAIGTSALTAARSWRR